MEVAERLQAITGIHVTGDGHQDQQGTTGIARHGQICDINIAGELNRR